MRKETSRLVIAALGSLALAVLSFAPARAGDEISFTVGTAKARPGEKAVLTVSVQTKVALQALSMALNFDESKVRVLDVSYIRASPSLDPEDPPGELTSTIFSNSDTLAGNQTSEGWLSIELKAVETSVAGLPLGAEDGAPVPLLEITFLVLPGAPQGFTPVTFEPVGPVDSIPSTYLMNLAVLAATKEVVSPVTTSGGGIDIDIIGEIGFFMRGDADFNRKRNITDPIVSLTYLFVGGLPLPCLDSADANDDGEMDVSDAVFSLHKLFQEGGSFPDPDLWGLDPTGDALGCAYYPGW